MKNDERQGLSRRDFLKRIGMTAGSAAAMMALEPLSVFGRNDEPKAAPTAGGMTYRLNRSTGDKVSLLGFGMMRLPQKDGQVDQQLVNRQVRYALEHGVNYFDTSPHYVRGRPEKSLGTALRESGFQRKDYYISTKMSNFGGDDDSFDGSVEMYHRSLEYLQTDYVDYYLLHGVGIGGMEALRKRFIDNGLLDYIQKEREAGHIRNLGFSYHDDIKVFDYLLSLNDKYHWDFVQIQMNYLDWKHAKQVNTWNTNAEYLYTECEKRGIQNVVMEPLLGGRLANLPTVYRDRLMARRPNDSIASWAFLFVGSHPNILTTLSGMTYMEHLKDNVQTYSPLDPCTTDELVLLEEIAANVSSNPLIPCTDCRYCMPCPYGVNIPGNFAYYNKNVNEGTLPPDAHDQKMKSFREGYRLSLGDKELATQCVGCKACQPKCPQHIRIPQQMARLSEMLEGE
ncbi:MAG: aldo/keto reductase [Prevotella sp.]|nr:aldo/keto reductase [Prevotella sp.]